ncbi:c-type cytochrome [Pontibacter chinhatensis]|uniref:Cytochrome c n=1 Tax=Pontibacter chinhatensis TaxID=1436961 RepID=A0A1I2X3C3_9BACT|nr:c-type cytochrome [Pontibacter chinhatensis]SFH08030.1 Cytochrome c [Pontibacter chinhatensis]
MKIFLLISSLLLFSILVLVPSPLKDKSQKNSKPATTATALQDDKEKIKLGEHLVLTSACHDCHTPKKMTDKGQEFDFSRALSGHPADMPPPEVDRKAMEQKGLVVTQTLTAWVGPWGISYAANITSDATGIGNWTEKQFFTAIRQGKYKGLENSRMLLPPMPWDMYKNMTDEELSAIYAYLKSTKPIKNVVPAAEPPVAAAAGK